MKGAIFPFGIIIVDNGKVVYKEKFEISIYEKFANKEIYKKFDEILKKYNAKEELLDMKEYYKQFFKDKDELINFLNEFFIRYTSKKIKESYSKDKIIIQLVKSLDSLNVAINNLYERFYELYGYYFPELTNKYREIDDFIKVIKKYFEREKIAKEYNLKNLMGFDLSEEELNIIKLFREKLLDLIKFRDKIEEKIKKLMEKEYVNLSKVATPIVGARLLELAGGIKQLALLPSSTIQVLGAEKALFRHLTKKTKPPKHGIILQHPLVLNAPKKLRGKIARTLASKISIAAKIDYFSKEDKSEKLLEELNKRIEEIKNESN